MTFDVQVAPASIAIFPPILNNESSHSYFHHVSYLLIISGMPQSVILFGCNETSGEPASTMADGDLPGDVQ